MTTRTTTIIIIINIISVVNARPIIKPVLELSLVDDVDAKIGKCKGDYETVVSCRLSSIIIPATFNVTLVLFSSPVI